MPHIYYAGVRFTKVTNAALNSFRFAHNLREYPKPAMGFHSTLVYSHTPFRISIASGIIPQVAIGLAGDTLELWGESLVLPYKSEWLNHLHREARRNGATWDWPNFIPHITIASEIKYLPGYFHHTIPIEILEIFYREWEQQD